jgi:hypothetical protein
MIIIISRSICNFTHFSVVPARRVPRRCRRRAADDTDGGKLQRGNSCGAPGASPHARRRPRGHRQHRECRWHHFVWRSTLLCLLGKQRYVCVYASVFVLCVCVLAVCMRLCTHCVSVSFSHVEIHSTLSTRQAKVGLRLQCVCVLFCVLRFVCVVICRLSVFYCVRRSTLLCLLGKQRYICVCIVYLFCAGVVSFSTTASLSVISTHCNSTRSRLNTSTH